MKKVLLVFTLMATAIFVKSQVGIGTNSPKATLDITAANSSGTSATAEGIIIPRVDRQRAQSMQNVEKSTIIYVNNITTGTQTGTAINIDTEGFYHFSGTAWIKLPGAVQTLEQTYWKAQALSTSPKNGDVLNKSASSSELVDVDIYQKGKVGIGYNSNFDIDFESNPTQKQLEVGGDFRAVYSVPGALKTDPPKRYLGIETNSGTMPSGFSSNGNLFYSSKNKNINDFMTPTIDAEGNLIIQDNGGIALVSRKGASSTLKLNSLDVKDGMISFGMASGFQSAFYDKYVNVELTLDGFSVIDWLNTDAQFGLDFTKKKFYIGDFSLNKTHYYFPQTRPTKDKQILEYSQATESLEWVDGGSSSASPKFFYMPSIVLPTTASGVTDYVTYNSADGTFSVDLYAIYKAQFDAPIKSSNGTSTGLAGFVLARDKYEYHIIYADKTVFPHANIVFSTTAGEEGKFTYKVDPNAIVRNGSFMNIVLKVK